MQVYKTEGTQKLHAHDDCIFNLNDMPHANSISCIHVSV